MSVSGSRFRFGWRAIVMAASVLALLVGLAAPASSGASSVAERWAKATLIAEQLGLDDVDPDVAPISLKCAGQITDAGATTGCRWRTKAPGVAGFQLWRLNLRVDDAERQLVGRFGADTTSATDSGVSAPGAYLYAVLGVDDAGEIVARSRVVRVRFRDPSIEPLRLECDVVDEPDAAVDTAAVDTAAGAETETDETATIGCAWSTPETQVRAYNLYRRVHGEGRTLIATLGADVTSYLDTELACGVRYGYQVEGVDESGATVARSRGDVAGCLARDRRDHDERRGDDAVRGRDTASETTVGSEVLVEVDDAAERDEDITADRPRDRDDQPGDDVHRDHAGDPVSTSDPTDDTGVESNAGREGTDDRPERDRHDRRGRGS